MQQLTDVQRAWQGLRSHFGIRSLIVFGVVLVILLGALNAAINELTGQNVAVDLFHWLISHLIFLASPIAVPIWLIAALSLLMLVLVAMMMIFGKQYKASLRKSERVAHDTHQWKERTLREIQKKSLLGKTLERLELATVAIVNTMKTVVADAQEIEKMLLDPTLSDQEKARHMAKLHQPIEGALNSLLGSVIIHAQELFGEPSDGGQDEVTSDAKVTRGGIVVPVSPETPYLVWCTDSGWVPEEKSLRFYIRYHPGNLLDRHSVAGAAYWLKKPQVCCWITEQQKFDHEESDNFDIYRPGLPPYRSFIAYPLQADCLFLTAEEDKRVLGVLCLDSPQASTFRGSPLLNQTSPQELPVIYIMRVMYYLLQLRQQVRSGSS